MKTRSIWRKREKRAFPLGVVDRANETQTQGLTVYSLDFLDVTSETISEITNCTQVSMNALTLK